MLKNSYLIKLSEEKDNDDYLRTSDLVLDTFNLDKDRFYLQSKSEQLQFTVFFITEKEFNPEGFFYINIFIFDNDQFQVVLKYDPSTVFSDIGSFTESKEKYFKDFVDDNFNQFTEIKTKSNTSINPFNSIISFTKRKNKDLDIELILEELKNKLILAGVHDDSELEERLSNHRQMTECHLTRHCTQNYVKKYHLNEKIEKLKELI